MLKISNGSLKIGMRISLPEEWHEKILQFSQEKDFPYEFFIEEIIKDKEKKEVYYICRSEKKETGKMQRLVFTEFVIRYLSAEEVPDLNIGLSFKEYLPLEESKLLITNVRNPSEVIPACLKVQPELLVLNKKSLICLNFELDFINGNGFTSIRYFCTGNRKYTWKLVLHEDTSYMTDYEETFRDTLIHKEFVIRSCEKLSIYLERQGAFEHANMLRERAKVHDNSKISCDDELRALSRIAKDKSSLKNSKLSLSPIKRDAIKLHWKHNSHHPEHYRSLIDMSKVDIMEMCCDWHARSTQWKTDFLVFVKDRQEDRFHFPEWMFAEIWHYCEVLNSKI